MFTKKLNEIERKPVDGLSELPMIIEEKNVDVF